MSNGRSDGMQEICGLWERTSANGREYIGGRTPDDEDITIPAGSFCMVFPNESDNPRAPAFRLLYSLPREDGQRRAQPQQQRGSFDRFKGDGQQQQAAPAPAQQQAAARPDDDEDLPF